VLPGLLSKRALFPDRFQYSAPEAHGLHGEDVELWAAGGPRLRGLLFRGGKRGVVVFCPGNSGNASSHFEYIRLVRESGRSVLLFDYRGFGRSEGEADLRTIVQDVEAAAEYAAYHTGEPVVLFGLSLGGPAAMACASLPQVQGIVAEGVADVKWMLRGLLEEGSFGPVRCRRIVQPGGACVDRCPSRLVKLRLPGPVAAAVSSLAAACYPFAAKSLRAVARRAGDTPVLLVHGVEDAVFPFEAALELHDALKGPKRIWLIPGVGHAQEPILAARAEYAAQLESFLAGVFEGGLSPPPPARVLEIHLQGAASPGVSARLGVDLPDNSTNGRALLSVTGGGVLAQALLGRQGELSVDLPGPIERLVTLELASPGTDPRAERYERGGYKATFRAMSSAVNKRDIPALHEAVARQLDLERDPDFDSVAALYALRAALEALRGARRGRVEWRAAREALERFLALWQSCPALPPADVCESPAHWAREELDASAGKTD